MLMYSFFHFPVFVPHFFSLLLHLLEPCSFNQYLWYMVTTQVPEQVLGTKTQLRPQEIPNLEVNFIMTFMDWAAL